MVTTSLDESTTAGDGPAEGQTQNHGTLSRFAPTARSDRAVGTGVSETENGATEGSSDRPDPSALADLPLTPIVGTVLTVAGLGAGLLVGFDAYAPQSTALGSAARALAALGYVAAGTLGTLWIVDDARYLGATEAEWRPNPWAYVGAGAAVVGGAISWWFRESLAADFGLVPSLAGVAVVSVCLASVVVGPVYLLQRRRHLGS